MRNETQAAAKDSLPDGTTAKDAPLPVDAPNMARAAQPAARDEGLIGPVSPLSMIAADAPADFKHEAAKAADHDADDVAAAAPRWPFAAQVPIAAAITVAAVVGALAGSAATGGLMYRVTTDTTLADDTQALRNSVAKLNEEFAAFKTGTAVAQRTVGTQMVKLGERIERAEKAQGEPAAKIAKLAESLDRVEKRQLAAGDVTGSISAPKEEARPPVAEGWRLRDYYAGRAIVESRAGTLFEVGVGANLPGLGKVEAIRRENGRLVLVARKGIIVASSEIRRPPGYVLPYRY